MPHDVIYTPDAHAELIALDVYDQRMIVLAVDVQLLHQPTLETRNRKPLYGLSPPWEGNVPVWEIKVGTWRVFYDVDEESEQVFIRAIRRKRPHQTTEQTL